MLVQPIGCAIEGGVYRMCLLLILMSNSFGYEGTGEREGGREGEGGKS